MSLRASCTQTDGVSVATVSTQTEPEFELFVPGPISAIAPEERWYVIWVLPGQPDCWGIAWRWLQHLLPNSSYTGSNARLRRAATQEEATLLYTREAARHGRPRVPAIYRLPA